MAFLTNAMEGEKRNKRKRKCVCLSEKAMYARGLMAKGGSQATNRKRKQSKSNEQEENPHHRAIVSSGDLLF